MKKKSMVGNTLIYSIKILMQAVFPIITFPYISRVLSVEGVGKYSFSNSYVSYFALLAGLGISTYAIREGARKRDDRIEFEKFACEVFTINIISSLVAVVLLLLSVFAVPSLQQYKNMIPVMAMTIPLTTLGTEWIFNVYEDFTYITVRSIAFQLISILLMFLCVKSPSDVENYALISVIASAGSNTLNFRNSRKYFNHHLSAARNLKKHLKPIFVLFASSIASQIYINADITMMGFMHGDYATGIYSVSSKVYNLVRLLLSAVITIILPRLSYIHAQERESEYRRLASYLFYGFMSIVLPACVGLACVSKNVIILLSGDCFLEAERSLQILCVALTFSLLGSFVANSVLIVNSQEKSIMKITMVGAMMNVFSNLVFIKYWSYDGAAITTVISEMIVFIFQFIQARKFVQFERLLMNLLKVFAGLISIVVCCAIISCANFESSVQLMIQIGLSCSVYFVIMIVLKQDFIYASWRKIINRIRS